MNKPTAVSLFSGIGGIDLAFKQAGFDMIWANEIDKFACVSYRNNFRCYISEADIKSIDEKTIPKADVLFGGFPCQSYPEFRITNRLLHVKKLSIIR